MQNQAIRAGDVFDAAVIHPRHPRNDGAEIEADAEFRTHRDLAAQAGDAAQHVAGAIAPGHEIRHDDGAAGSLESRFQDQGAIAVAAVRLVLLYPVAISHRPCDSFPSSAAKHAALSKRGRQSQSIEPSRPTRAAVSQLPMTA